MHSDGQNTNNASSEERSREKRWSGARGQTERVGELGRWELQDHRGEQPTQRPCCSEGFWHGLGLAAGGHGGLGLAASGSGGLGLRVEGWDWLMLGMEGCDWLLVVVGELLWDWLLVGVEG